MSSTDDNLDNSTTALLQPDATDTTDTTTDHNITVNHDEELSSLTEGDQQQQKSQKESKPLTDTSSTPQQEVTTKPEQQNGETEPDIQKETSPPSDDLKIIDEEDNKNSDNSKPSSATPNDNGGTNLTEEQTEPVGSSSPPTKSEGSSKKKPSRRARFVSTLNHLPAEKVQKARMATSIEDIGSLRLWKGIVAEFLGTLLLTLVGCGSCINIQWAQQPTSPVVQIALCFGLSVATIVWAIGHVSGGHINPAVTVAMLATRKISLVKAVFFIIFQLIGAIVGAGLLYGMTPSEHRGNLGATLVHDSLNVGQAVGVEIFITFVLVFVVFSSVDNKRRDLNGSTPLTIGLSVTMCHLFAVDYTGSSMNTARSFGPAVVMGNWDDHWVYWLGPILGGVMAGLLYDNLFAVNASLSKAKACLLSSDYDDERYQAQKMKIRILEEDTDEPKDDLPMGEKSQNADGDPSNA